MSIRCHNSAFSTSAKHCSSIGRNGIKRKGFSVDEYIEEVRQSNLRDRERERRRVAERAARTKKTTPGALKRAPTKGRYVECQCGVRFFSSHPNVKWHSNKCRTALTRNPKALFVVRARKRRNAMVNLAPGVGHTHEQWMARLKIQGYTCHYCGAELTSKNWTRDHKNPLSRGGSDEISNIVAACRRCNCRKGALTDTEFINKTEKIKTAEEAAQFLPCAKGGLVASGRVLAAVNKPKENYTVVAVISTLKRAAVVERKSEFTQLPLLTNSFSS